MSKKLKKQTCKPGSVPDLTSGFYHLSKRPTPPELFSRPDSYRDRDRKTTTGRCVP